MFKKLIRSDEVKECKLGQNAENKVLLTGFILVLALQIEFSIKNIHKLNFYVCGYVKCTYSKISRKCCRDK